MKFPRSARYFPPDTYQIIVLWTGLPVCLVVVKTLGIDACGDDGDGDDDGDDDDDDYNSCSISPLPGYCVFLRHI